MSAYGAPAGEVVEILGHEGCEQQGRLDLFWVMPCAHAQAQGIVERCRASILTVLGPRRGRAGR